MVMVWSCVVKTIRQGTQRPRERFEKLRRGIHSGPLEGRPQITGPTAPHHIGFATLVDLLACQSAIGLRETAQVARRGHVQRADQRLLMPGFELPTLGSLRSFAALLLSEATAPRRPCPAGRLASGRAASIDAGLGNCRRCHAGRLARRPERDFPELPRPGCESLPAPTSEPQPSMPGLGTKSGLVRIRAVGCIDVLGVHRTALALPLSSARPHAD